jgi:sec-independent protein translocase protein TatC
MSFWDHVEELRQRMVRSICYVVVAACVAWFFRRHLLAALEYPALEGARRAGVKDFAFRIFEAAGGLMLMVQVALVAGVLLASPLLTWELWGFIAPALHPHEKRWVRWVVPTATALFLAGAATCYWIAPSAFAFMLRFNITMGAQPELTLGPYLYFFMRLLLVFGILFELPLFLMILAVPGLVTSRGLLRQWRLAVVLVFLVAAVATPTGDALTMTVLAAPMLVLYALSVFLVRLVEARGARAASSGAASQASEAPQAPVPPAPAPGSTQPTPAESQVEEFYRRAGDEVPPPLDP